MHNLNTPSKKNITDNNYIKTIYKIHDLYEEEDFIKDCPNSEFTPTFLPSAKRIIAMGDFHGDLDLVIRSFKLPKLVDDDLNWIADPPDTIVVHVGDKIDSCRPIPNIYNCQKKKYPHDKAEDINVINFLEDIRKKALQKGGNIIQLLGNHEIMNAQGKFDYVSYENYYNFRYDKNDISYIGPEGRYEAFKPGGPIAKLFACTNTSVVVIGSSMFVHAGILPVLAKRLDYLNIDNDSKLKYLNAVVRKWLLHKLSENDSLAKSLFINDLKLSPFWTRIYGTIPDNTPLKDPKCFDSVKKALEVYKIGHIVIGHTPQLPTNNSGINGTCYEKKKTDNKLYRIDGGFSRAFSILSNNQNLVQVLEIIDDNEFRILTDPMFRTYVAQPDVDISDRQMKNIAPIYSQNRIQNI